MAITMILSLILRLNGKCKSGALMRRRPQNKCPNLMSSQYAMALVASFSDRAIRIVVVIRLLCRLGWGATDSSGKCTTSPPGLDHHMQALEARHRFERGNTVPKMALCARHIGTRHCRSH